MYFTIGWPQTLNGCEGVESIVPNSDHSIFLFLSKDTISLWYCRPVVQLLKYRRRPDSVEEFGVNVSAVWKSDSSQIVVQTSRDTLLFYNLVYAEDNKTVLELNDSRKSEYVFEPPIPSLVLELHTRIPIRDGVTCLMAAEEAVVIANRNSRNTIEICGIEWEGRIDPNFHLSVSVPNTSKALSTSKNQSFTVCDIKFSTIIGGFSLVLSNNIGGFLPLGDSHTTGNSLQVISGVDSPKCTAINHKYALIAYGLESSAGVLCQYDDINCRFFITHRLVLPSNSHGDINKSLGAMNCLQWSPDLTVLVTSWENGGFALWTVFGSLLSCSLSWNCSSISTSISPFVVTSIAFGKEGYHLYLSTRSSSSFHTSDNQSNDQNTDKQNNNHFDTQQDNHFNTVYKLSLARSVLAANPSSSVTAETVLLASEDKLYIGGNKNLSLFTQYTADEKESLPIGLTNLILSEQQSNVDSFQWLTVPMNQYLDYNWPIRFFAIDPVASQNLAVAGTRGFAVYSLFHRKWRMFNYENHERDFLVTGGFLWYNNFLICGCLNQTKAEGFEIRAYSTRTRFDNAFAKIISVESDVVSLSLHRNRLLALCSNGAIFLYDLHQITVHTRDREINEFDLNISAPIRVILSNFHIIPDCVTMCLLTDLHVDMYHSFISNDSLGVGSYQSQNHHRKRGQAIQIAAVAKSLSILLNIFGKVYLCEIDIDTTTLPLSSEDEDDDTEEQSGSLSASALASLADEYEDEDEERASLSSSNSVNVDSERDSIPVSSSNDKKRGRTLSQATEPINVIRYKKTTILASNVESLWISPQEQTRLNAFRSGNGSNSGGNVQMKPHLETSLYLNCGAQGMAVWLSLEHSMIRKGGNRNSSGNSSFHLSSETEHAYISKRIMLPLTEMSSHIYPLAVRSRDVIVLGAESDFSEYSSKMNFNNTNSEHTAFEALHSLPFCVIKRTSQVYLHYILRELLRRNLGYRAWEIANTCTALPHFVHSLELLLHGVLEEEAGNSAVIPDPLLPRVVEFIRAFPVFLQTVIHCARKTELALWPHLFSVVGSPKDLFHQCIAEGQLDTASSYIIVLQNLEKPDVATKCVSKLLQAARIAGSWSTIKELKRFVRATQEQEAQQNQLKSRTESVSSTNYETGNGSSPTQDDREHASSPQKISSESALSRSNSANSQYKCSPDIELSEQEVLVKAEDNSSAKSVEQDTTSIEELQSLEPEIERMQIDLDTATSERVLPQLLSPSLSVSSSSSCFAGFGAPRAYPGSIKLMGNLTHESIHLNGAPFQFLAASNHRQQELNGALLGTCSISSINSISSVASSSMSLSNSSTSSSPAVVIRPQANSESEAKLNQIILQNGTKIKETIPNIENSIKNVIKTPKLSESDGADNVSQCFIS